MLKVGLLIFLVAVIAPAANAQAFGVTMGAPISKFANAEKFEQAGPITLYKLETLPSPHSEFESYLLAATPAQGVCKVMGLGKTHRADKSGTSVRSAYEDLVEALNAKYGHGEEYDFSHAGALWKDSDEFAMALRQNERTLAALWSRSKGSSLPEDIEGISLDTSSPDGSSTYLTLTYEFSNFAACKGELQKRDSRGL